MKKILFNDLQKQYRAIKPEIDRAVAKVLTSGRFILGKEVAGFEKGFARYIGTEYAVGVASGTEALALALMACGVGRGDEVITVPNTAMPTVSAISMVDARPVFVDIDERTYLMDADKIAKAATSRTRAIIPVHLYGQTTRMDVINRIARARGLFVIEDACQAHGSEFLGRKAGAWGDMGCFSFYPTKNLGCYGDGGMITTNDRGLYKRLMMLRNYGQRDRYRHEIQGINSRLDELQAAVLRVKLKRLDAWNERRRKNADVYDRMLSDDRCIKPFESPDGRHGYHLYVVRVKKREWLQVALRQHGVDTLIHYPIPVHLQKAYQWLGYKRQDFPVTERCAQEILSLPMSPELTAREIEYIAENINSLQRTRFEKRQ
ncbi:MAG TPA: DegT/DnrJ/EryC1/StrS family aminotransferase [bacterium]